MRVAVSTGLGQGNREEAVSYVLEAERLGVSSVWSSEAWGTDAVTPLAYLAARTSTIKLGTSIMQAGTRSPALIAMTALTLAALSDDRFVLGLGTSGPQVIEGWHGVRYHRPVTRLRETVEIVRMALRGERVVYRGTVYELPLPDGEGRALKVAAAPRDVPIYLATLSARSLEMTGAIADGWLASAFMPDHAEAFFEPMRRGAEAAGRAFDAIDRHAGGVVAFGDDLDRLIAPRKPGFAFQIGAMGSRDHNFYKEAYERQGYGAVAQRVQTLWLEHRREEAADLIPDEFVLKANLLGTEQMVKERLRVYREAGVTTLHASPQGRTLAERLETLGRLMDLVTTVNGEGA
ncbi:MAG TPA: LLM class flavin-dependent oxidoreductase [Methylomirabilota bacterium]|jgi:F420-dependent oxidoreductase-like protein|nr:LLM class flavin-dependent oxidoreductase [Methylomirabilota bacterium]